jgi:iron-regulated transporter 1
MQTVLQVACADGTKYDPAKYNVAPASTGGAAVVGPNGLSTSGGPLLTAEEIEAKYVKLYDQYSRAEPSPTVNFTFVVLLVMTGLTIVLAIPYFLMRKRVPGGKGKPETLAGSFAAMIQQSKKKSSGHIN